MTKEYDNVCGAVLASTNPGSEALECVKQLLKLRKYDAINTTTTTTQS